MRTETHFKTLEYTESQEQALEKLKKFLGSSERYFRLTGKAGTGKTTIIKYALEEYIKQDLNLIKNEKKADFMAVPQVLGVCLAHKAKDNLRQSIPFVNTFASAYGHIEIIDSSGRKKFVPNKDKMKYADCKKPIRYYVIDEAGQFNAKMARLVHKETNMFAKIIYMGDRGQLPPIDDEGKEPSDKDSPIFDMMLPDFCSHELTERVRQTEGNSIVDFSDIIYGQIFSTQDLSKVHKHMMRPNLDSAGRGYNNCRFEEVYDLFKRSSNNYLDTKMIAYKNNTVNISNHYMRNYIHDNPQEIFIPKEIIYMNKTFYGRDHEDRPFTFYNSSEYIIENTSIGSLHGLKVMYAFLDGSKPMPVIYGGIGSKNHNMYLERIEVFNRTKDWKSKYAFMDMFGDFNYGYTLTCYKAQGSTYRNVFVDVSDIMSVGPLSNKRKLQTLYTALTRASHRATFIIPE